MRVAPDPNFVHCSVCWCVRIESDWCKTKSVRLCAVRCAQRGCDRISLSHHIMQRQGTMRRAQRACTLRFLLLLLFVCICRSRYVLVWELMCGCCRITRFPDVGGPRQGHTCAHCSFHEWVLDEPVLNFNKLMPNLYLLYVWVTIHVGTDTVLTLLLNAKINAVFQ